MERLELRLTPDEFARLPRSAAYKYAYHDGSAWLNPRPRYYHARLDLAAAALDGAASVPIRPLAAGDWDALVGAFAEAFAEHLPFAGLDPRRRAEAAAVCLERTRTGGDGPCLEQASFVALAPAGGPLGALLTTLVPLEYLADWGVEVRFRSPPAGTLERLGRPHLTWVFVRPAAAGRGVGMALLGRAAATLVGLGFDELYTTFLAGNDSSMLWHWRAGFRLLSHPSSPRLTRGG
jgi:GNAT superfamily N-acetyltransferase